MRWMKREKTNQKCTVCPVLVAQVVLCWSFYLLLAWASQPVDSPRTLLEPPPPDLTTNHSPPSQSQWETTAGMMVLLQIGSLCWVIVSFPTVDLHITDSTMSSVITMDIVLVLLLFILCIVILTVADPEYLAQFIAHECTINTHNHVNSWCICHIFTVLYNTILRCNVQLWWEIISSITLITFQKSCSYFYSIEYCVYYITKQNFTCYHCCCDGPAVGRSSLQGSASGVMACW